MEPIQAIIRRLEGRGMNLSAVDGQIRFRGPRDADNAQDLEQIAKRKDEAHVFLKTRTDPAPVTVCQRQWLRPDQDQVPLEYQRTPATFDLSGPLDVPRFSHALRLLRERQDILCTRYGRDEDGGLFQTTDGVAEPDPPRLIDLVGLPELEQRRRIWLMVRDEFDQPLDRESGQAMVTWIFRLEADKHVFAILVDHIALDNRSMQIILTEIFRLYDGLVEHRPTILLPLKARYADYARTVRDRQSLAALGENLAWWRKKIGDLQPIDLRDPGLRNEGASPRRAIPLRFSEAARGAAGELAREEGVTLSVVMTAVFGLLMARWADADRILTGYLVDDRPADMADTAGSFIRTAPLIVDVTGDPTARELIARTRSAILDAINPERVIWSRDIPRLPHALINLQTPFRPNREARPGGLVVTPRRLVGPLANKMSLDFQIFMKVSRERLGGHVRFAVKRVNPQSVRWFAMGATVVLDRMIQDPDAPLSQIAPPRQMAETRH